MSRRWNFRLKILGLKIEVKSFVFEMMHKAILWVSMSVSMKMHWCEVLIYK
jgi:hypothetical protein